MSNDFRSAGRTVTVVLYAARSRPKCLTEEKCFKTIRLNRARELQHKVSVFREFHNHLSHDSHECCYPRFLSSLTHNRFIICLIISRKMALNRISRLRPGGTHHARNTQLRQLSLRPSKVEILVTTGPSSVVFVN